MSERAGQDEMLELMNGLQNLRFAPNQYTSTAVNGTSSTVENANASRNPSTVNLYRYFNPNIPDHLYTTNWEDLKGGLNGYGYEGIAAQVYAIQIPGTYPFRRYYNQGNGDHFYTMESGEFLRGYDYEGILCYIFASYVEGTLPFYRYRSPTGNHFYTKSKVEIERLECDGCHVGIAGYVCPNPDVNTWDIYI